MRRDANGAMKFDLSDDQIQQVQAEIFAGRKISAIKLCREFTGQGLKETKDFVEALETELRRTTPNSFTAPPGGQGCVGAAAAIVIIAGVALATSI